MLKKVLTIIATVYAATIASLFISKRARETTVRMTLRTQQLVYRAIKNAVSHCKNIMTFEEFERRGKGPKPLGPTAVYVKYPEKKEVIELTY